MIAKSELSMEIKNRICSIHISRIDTKTNERTCRTLEIMHGIRPYAPEFLTESTQVAKCQKKSELLSHGIKLREIASYQQFSRLSLLLKPLHIPTQPMQQRLGHFGAEE
jgi:hypothetical protein